MDNVCGTIMSVDEMASQFPKVLNENTELRRRIAEFKAVIKEKEDYLEKLERENLELKAVRDELRKGAAGKKKSMGLGELFEYLKEKGVTGVTLNL